MKNKPLISIVLPVCDAERYLKDCIQTIKRQSYKNFEVIAVDDASKDRSFHILRQIRKRDKRFRVYQNRNRYGLSITLNRALRRARGNYIAFMDPHSKNYYHRLKSQLMYLLENPKVAAVGAQRKLIKSKGSVISESNFPTDHDRIHENLLAGNSIQPETLMINKKILPRDLLKFENEPYPYLYSNLLMKIGNYAKVENLERSLLYLRKYRKNHHIDMENVGKTVEFVKLWFKTRTYEQKPPLRSLFSQVLGVR
ncbi:MAG: glycosyltransferase family 2 protein [Patescibacteria group bacterium]